MINFHSPLDCSQVQAIYRYETSQPGELSLEESDVIKVIEKNDNGTCIDLFLLYLPFIYRTVIFCIYVIV